MLFPRRKISTIHLLKIAVLAGAALCLQVNAAGQAGNTRVKIILPAEGDLTVEVQTTTASDSWSFRNAYAGVLGLGDRIKVFASDEAVVKRVASGEFRSDRPSATYRYTVDIRRPEPGSVSHVSWVNNQNGMLMLGDLLPQNLTQRDERKSILVELVLPAGWTTGSVFTVEGASYVISDPETAVFLIGRSLQLKSKAVNGDKLDLVISGAWPFSVSRTLEIAARVLKKYTALTGLSLKRKSAILVAPMPAVSSVNQWKAETRGSTIILLIDPGAKFPTWTGQLGVIFTHEILHLWVPNSLLLGGDYDWFFEGFTLYQALLTSLELKLISFEEYLDTLARVYDSYLSFPDNFSLLQASERRWTNSGSFVYDKGMLVAFMYDVLIRSRSGGKMKVSDLYSRLFAGYTNKPADGNEVIIGLLSSFPEARELGLSYIESSNALNLDQFLSKFGFHLDTSASQSRLSINRQLSEEQTRLMRSLGYRK